MTCLRYFLASLYPHYYYYVKLNKYLVHNSEAKTDPDADNNMIEWVTQNTKTAKELQGRALLTENGLAARFHPLWIIRAEVDGTMLTGKYDVKRNVATIPVNGNEREVDSFEVATGDTNALRWIPFHSGHVSRSAIPCGTTNQGEEVYIGRAMMDGVATPGSIITSERCMLVPYGGKTVRTKNYQVLSRIRTKQEILSDKKPAEKPEWRELVEQEPYYLWSPTTTDEVMKHAKKYPPLIAGFHNGEPLWLIRTNVNGDLIPGKFDVKRKKASISYNGREYVTKNFEMMCMNPKLVRWEKVNKDGKIPDIAVKGGVTADGKPLYIGRTFHENNLCIGKVIKGDRKSGPILYFPYNGREYMKSQEDGFFLLVVYDREVELAKRAELIRQGLLFEEDYFE